MGIMDFRGQFGRVLTLANWSAVAPYLYPN